MSGLTVFFRRYLMGQDISTDVPTSDTTDDATTWPNESIATTTTTTPTEDDDRNIVAMEIPEQNPTPTSVTNKDDNNSEHEDEDRLLLYQRSISASTQPRTSQRSPGSTFPGPAMTMTNHTTTNTNSVSFKEWRKQQTSYIQEYIAQRLFDTSNSTTRKSSTNDINDNGEDRSTSNHRSDLTQDGDDDDDDDDAVVVESQSQPFIESQVLESQLPETQVGTTSTEAPFPRAALHVSTLTTTTAPTNMTSTVPNVMTDTYYRATHIQELDLYVCSFHSATVLPVTKVWSKRRTLERRRRHKPRQPPPSKKQRTIAPPPSPNVSFEYDGPLAVLYDRVLCMELVQSPKNEDHAGTNQVHPDRRHTDTQLHTLGHVLDHGVAATTITDAAILPHTTPHDIVPHPGNTSRIIPQRTFHNIKLFWYDIYADMIHTIITKAHQYLQHQPPTAIAPHREITATTTATTTTTVTNTTKDVLSSTTVALYLSLQNIPAKCIFPYYDPVPASTVNDETMHRETASGFTIRPDWYDTHHTVPYCICIGGDSAMIVQATSNADENIDKNSNVTMVQESHGGVSQSSSGSSTIDPTTNHMTIPIAFDTDERPNAEPIQIKYYMIPTSNSEEIDDNNNIEPNNDLDQNLPHEIVEYTISTDTKQLQIEIWNRPTDAEQIRTIWEQVRRQRPHLVLTKDRNGHPFRPPIDASTGITDSDDQPIGDEEQNGNVGRPPFNTTTTPTRMSFAELTSPGERLKRRRLINIALDDMQYQLVRLNK